MSLWKCSSMPLEYLQDELCTRKQDVLIHALYSHGLGVCLIGVINIEAISDASVSFTRSWISHYSYTASQKINKNINNQQSLKFTASNSNFHSTA